MKHLQVVDITLTDSAIEPEEIHVKAHEPVRFVVWNHGTMEHEFRVKGVAGHVEVEHVEPGRAMTLEHTFHQTGVFETACPHPGHERMGMRGKIVVE